MTDSSFESKKSESFDGFWNDDRFLSNTVHSADTFRIGDKYFYTEYDNSLLSAYFAKKLRDVFYQPSSTISAEHILHVKVLGVKCGEAESIFMQELIGRQVRNRCLYESLNSYSVSIGIEGDGNIISLYDRSRNRAVILLHERGFYLNERYFASPLRFIFEEWFRETDYQLIHAGGLLIADQGVLFIGPSGQGKSTTVAAGLFAGLVYLGDDYLVVVPSGSKFHAFPLYASLKSDYPFIGTDGFFNKSTKCLQSSKNIFYLRHKDTFDFANRKIISHLVLPAITNQSICTLQRIGAFKAMQALLPSTLLQSHIINQQRVVRLKSLVESSQCFQLNVVNDLHAVGNLILSLGSS